MGIKKRTTTTVRCDFPEHTGDSLLIIAEPFHLLQHINGRNIVVCDECWTAVVTPESILQLLGVLNVQQTVKKQYEEVEL